MNIITRKNNKRGEILVILNKSDCINSLLQLNNWVCVNEIFNDFNKDPNITDVYLYCNYSETVTCDEINNYLKTIKENVQEHLNNNSNNKCHCNTKEKVNSDNTIDFSDDKKDENDNCIECSGEHVALFDSAGNKYPCKSCLEIDAYLKGKKEGYQLAIQECMNIIHKSIEETTENLPKSVKDEINEVIHKLDDNYEKGKMK